MCYKKKEKVVVQQVDTEKSYDHRIGQLKGAITNVLDIFLAAKVIEEYKPELVRLKEQINKSKLL